MSAKERDRLKVLHEVKQRHITQKQAGAELGLSVRWVRKLLVRLRTRGDAGLRHGLRGRASNRKRRKPWNGERWNSMARKSRPSSGGTFYFA